MAFVDDVVQDELRMREITIEPRSGSERPVTAALWTRQAAEAGMPLVCFGHGASGDRFQQPIPWLVQRLVGQHGFAALSIDGPVHGRRQVGAGGRDEFWPEWRREGTVEEMNADWGQALDFVQSADDVGRGPVGYWGLSMGTIYGAPFVAAEPRITVAVLGLMGLVAEPAHYAPTIRAAATGIACPVLFLWQLEDELFSRADCLALFDALASEDKRLHANPGLHPNVPFEELDHSVEFLAGHLDGTRPARQVMAPVSE